LGQLSAGSIPARGTKAWSPADFHLQGFFVR